MRELIRDTHIQTDRKRERVTYRDHRRVKEKKRSRRIVLRCV